MGEAAGLTTADLARLVGDVTAMAPAASDTDRVDRLRLFEQLKAAVASAQMSTAVELADSRRRADAAAGVPPRRQGAGAAGEIGLARRISPAQARRWLGLARILPRELPATFAALTEGRTTEWRALLVARETIFLSRADRATVDRELAPRLERWGDRQVEAETRRAAYRLDPAGAAERSRNATADRRVTVRPAPDSMCRVSALLPVQQGVAAYAALKQHADTVVGTGRQGANPDGTLRTRGQVMADTLVERVTGQVAADDVAVEITLVMTDRTLCHGDDEAGELLGLGPLPAPRARELALRDTGAARWVRRLFTSPDGSQLAAMETHRRAFTANQRRFVRLRDGDTCRTPWCDAPVRHIDHVDDWSRSERTDVAAAQGYCESCNYTKQAAGWRTRARPDGAVVTRTPTGHEYVSPLPRPPGTRRLRPDLVPTEVAFGRALLQYVA